MAAVLAANPMLVPPPGSPLLATSDVAMLQSGWPRHVRQSRVVSAAQWSPVEVNGSYRPSLKGRRADRGYETRVRASLERGDSGRVRGPSEGVTPLRRIDVLGEAYRRASRARSRSATLKGSHLQRRRTRWKGSALRDRTPAGRNGQLGEVSGERAVEHGFPTAAGPLSGPKATSRPEAMPIATRRYDVVSRLEDRGIVPSDPVGPHNRGVPARSKDLDALTAEPRCAPV
jgi:hypothetical protein